MANVIGAIDGAAFAHSGAASDRNPGGLSSASRGTPRIEAYEVYQPMLYPSQLNNPVLTVPANFGGQDGLSNYPIRNKYARYNAGVGYMYDTRDFVNHNLDSRATIVPQERCLILRRFRTFSSLEVACGRSIQMERPTCSTRLTNYTDCRLCSLLNTIFCSRCRVGQHGG